MYSVGHAQCLVVKKRWLSAVFAMSSVGHQQCCPQVRLAEGGVAPCVLVLPKKKGSVGHRKCWAIGGAGRKKCLAVEQCRLWAGVTTAAVAYSCVDRRQWWARSSAGHGQCRCRVGHSHGLTINECGPEVVSIGSVGLRECWSQAVLVRDGAGHRACWLSKQCWSRIVLAGGRGPRAVIGCEQCWRRQCWR